MRRSLLALAVTAMALQLAPARASSRAVEATIEFATGGTPRWVSYQDPAWAVWCALDTSYPACAKEPFPRPQRCLYTLHPGLAQEGSTGRFGYVVELGEQEGDGTHLFSLAETSGSFVSFDFDVMFYSRLGTCVAVGNPLTFESCDTLTGEFPQPCEGAGPPVFGRVGSDAGPIAQGMRYALVTLFAGVNGTFRFEIT